MQPPLSDSLRLALLNVVSFEKDKLQKAIDQGDDAPASAPDEFFRSNLDAKPGPIDSVAEAGKVVIGETPPPWPNELENFVSMNCIMTLSALSVEEINDPIGTFRTNPPKHVIIRSGGTGSKKVKTAYEEALGGNVEFFIDNLNFQQNIAPLVGSSNSNITSMSFTVTEPYSMGLFWEALAKGAKDAGFVDYTDCPFLLTVQFMGWDDNGTQKEVPFSRRMFPIKLLNSTFGVTEGGSEYNVEAMAWNETGMADSTTQIKTDVVIKGNTIQEILQTGEFAKSSD